MPKAFILGGGGQIGRAVALDLLANGWEVVVGGRRPAPAGPYPDRLRYVRIDRARSGALRTALGDGADLLVHCIAFTETDAQELVEVADAVERICVISSISVYADAVGRTLDEARLHGFPDMPVTMTKDQATVAPGDATYSTRKVAMERRLLDGASDKARILRAGAIHGPGSRHAREWWFAKRLIDGRARIPVAYGGESRFHTSATRNIAAAVLACAVGDMPPVTNVVDPVPPSVCEIGAAIMAALGREAEIVKLPDHGYPPGLGATPWSVPRPFVCAPSAAYAAKGGYADLVGPAIRDLIERTRDRDWREVPPQLAAYPYDLFDYAAEDRALAALAG